MKNRDPVDLDRRILSALASGPLTTAELARKAGVIPEVVERHCLALKRSQRLLDLDERDAAILTTLRQGRLSTHDLAQKLGQTGKEVREVYQRCRRLEDRGHFLSSKLEASSRKLLFLPSTGDVLNRSNYADIKETLAALREIARRHSLPRKAQIPPSVKDELRREYDAYLTSLEARVSPHEQGKIRSLRKELMGVLAGTTLAEVAAFATLRQFHPAEKIWDTVHGSIDLVHYLGVWLEGRGWTEGGVLPGSSEVFWALRFGEGEEGLEELRDAA